MLRFLLGVLSVLAAFANFDAIRLPRIHLNSLTIKVWPINGNYQDNVSHDKDLESNRFWIFEQLPVGSSMEGVMLRLLVGNQKYDVSLSVYGAQTLIAVDPISSVLQIKIDYSSEILLNWTSPVASGQQNVSTDSEGLVFLK